MTHEDLTDDVLAKVPLLAGLSSEERQQLAGISNLHVAKAGERLVKEGGQTQRLWIVISGTIEVVRSMEGRRTVVLASLNPYDHFGEMSFFEQAPHSASVRAKSDAHLMNITFEDYQQLIDGQCASAYKLAYNIVSSLAQRLRDMDDWVTELLRTTPEEKRDVETPQQRREWNEFREKLFGSWYM